MRKKKVYYGRKGQGRLYLQPRKKRANIGGGVVRDERETMGAYLLDGRLRR